MNFKTLIAFCLVLALATFASAARRTYHDSISGSLTPSDDSNAGNRRLKNKK